MTYTAREIAPGVFHIKDPLGVHLTLLAGKTRALLFDTGYGASDTIAFISTLTSLPLTVVLSHGHHDHALGARWFPETYMHPSDLPVFESYTGTRERERLIIRAGLAKREAMALRNANIPKPKPLLFEEMDLGGLSALPLRAPGHTPGSTALLVRERRLLLLGDCWNPQTWLFFPEALEVGAYINTLNTLMGLPFNQALAPHMDQAIDKAFLTRFTAALTPENLEKAEPRTMPGYENIPALALEPVPGYPLIFKKPSAQQGFGG